MNLDMIDASQSERNHMLQNLIIDKQTKNCLDDNIFYGIPRVVGTKC